MSSLLVVASMFFAVSRIFSKSSEVFHILFLPRFLSLFHLLKDIYIHASKHLNVYGLSM